MWPALTRPPGAQGRAGPPVLTARRSQGSQPGRLPRPSLGRGHTAHPLPPARCSSGGCGSHGATVGPSRLVLVALLSPVPCRAAGRSLLVKPSNRPRPSLTPCCPHPPADASAGGTCLGPASRHAQWPCGSGVEASPRFRPHLAGGRRGASLPAGLPEPRPLLVTGGPCRGPRRCRRDPVSLELWSRSWEPAGTRDLPTCQLRAVSTEDRLGGRGARSRFPVRSGVGVAGVSPPLKWTLHPSTSWTRAGSARAPRTRA